MDKNSVYKELLKSKEMARFSHYCAGSLYYHIQLVDGLYEFPVKTVEHNLVENSTPITTLSEDLGLTKFYSEVKGSELNRWIAKAIDKNEFIKISL